MTTDLKENFYELRVYSSNALGLFLDFTFSLGVECVEEEKECFVIRDENELGNVKFGLEEYARALENSLGCAIDLRIEQGIKENKDWLNEYKKNVKPIEIGDLYIHPSWEKPKPDLINVVIDPALAFGSGHHESTSACIYYLQKYSKAGMSAIDVGCGSGILSISL